MSKIILGLDLGSNSLGWALLSANVTAKGKIQPTDIIDMGVRIFPKAVEAAGYTKTRQTQTKTA